MDIQKEIRRLAGDIFEDTVRLRRHLHAHPELSFHENETAAFVKAELDRLGIEARTGIAGTGLVALIHGKGTSKTIALRADMDALPIREQNEVPYRSTREGVMHACGHDLHTSSLLGTARILHSLREHFPGTVKLIFQPAEERSPGGASLMIKEGVLKDPEVSAIIGQHVQPQLEAGRVAIRSGIYMASADEVYIRVIGKGGHGAHPRNFIDPVSISAQIIVSLQQLISRTADPRIPCLLSIGKVIAEGATNVIPNEVYMEGTLRTMDEDWRAEALDRIRSIVNNLCQAMGARAEIDLRSGYPVLHNHEMLTQRTREAMVSYVGEDKVEEAELTMGAEDFASYCQEAPGCFYRLGIRNESKGIVHGLHTPLFDVDEDSMRLSTGLMAWIAVSELNRG
jgi:amidohydrolase